LATPEDSVVEDNQRDGLPVQGRMGVAPHRQYQWSGHNGDRKPIAMANDTFTWTSIQTSIRSLKIFHRLS